MLYMCVCRVSDGDQLTSMLKVCMPCFRWRSADLFVAQMCMSCFRQRSADFYVEQVCMPCFRRRSADFYLVQVCMQCFRWRSAGLYVVEVCMPCLRRRSVHLYNVHVQSYARHAYLIMLKCFVSFQKAIYCLRFMDQILSFTPTISISGLLVWRTDILSDLWTNTSASNLKTTIDEGNKSAFLSSWLLV